MNSVGNYLRSKREEQGLSLDDVARETKVTKRYLRALEEENFDQLPADVYTRGFLRTYARLLGLDSEALIREYEKLRPREQTILEPEENSSDGLPAPLMYWVLMFLVLLIGLVVIVLRFGWISPEQASQLQKRLMEEQVARSKASEGLVIRAEAKEKTWVLITFDGIQKEQSILHPGQTRIWDAKETLLLRVGNAGGLTLYHNGEKLPSLGESGEVVKTVINLHDDGEVGMQTLNTSGQ